MYHNAVNYKDQGYLAPGSQAMELYQAKKFAALDKHLAELTKTFNKMERTK